MGEATIKTTLNIYRPRWYLADFRRCRYRAPFLNRQCLKCRLRPRSAFVEHDQQARKQIMYSAFVLAIVEPNILARLQRIDRRFVVALDGIPEVALSDQFISETIE